MIEITALIVIGILAAVSIRNAHTTARLAIWHVLCYNRDEGEHIEDERDSDSDIEDAEIVE